MSCKICDRSSCIESFHSIETQEAFEKYGNWSNENLVRELIDKNLEIENLKDDILGYRIERDYFNIKLRRKNEIHSQA